MDAIRLSWAFAVESICIGDLRSNGSFQAVISELSAAGPGRKRTIHPAGQSPWISWRRLKWRARFTPQVYRDQTQLRMESSDIRPRHNMT